MQQADLRPRCAPASLAFANYMDRLVAGDRAPSGPKRSEVLTRVDPSLGCGSRSFCAAIAAVVAQLAF